MTDDSNDDEVGYGKPPKAHRFKKGQSGCPSGGHDKRRANKAKREKAERDKYAEAQKRVEDIIAKVGLEEISVRTSAGVVRMPRVEATVRKVFDSALRSEGGSRQMSAALALSKHAKLLDPLPKKGRPMVLVVNPIMEPEAWAKATEGELLPKNPLHGIPGAENLLEGPKQRNTKIPDEDEDE